MNLKQLQTGIPVEVSAHRSLNSCKGVIWAPHLAYDKEEEILTETRKHGVKEVQRMQYRNREGNLAPSHRYLLNFDSPHLPQTIKITNMNLKVETYIPS